MRDEQDEKEQPTCRCVGKKEKGTKKKKLPKKAHAIVSTIAAVIFFFHPLSPPPGTIIAASRLDRIVRNRMELQQSSQTAHCFVAAAF